MSYMRTLCTTLVIMVAIGAYGSINTNKCIQQDAELHQRVKSEIGLDYSMPDYKCSKIDERKMGEHLAKMLRQLHENSGSYTYYRQLSAIQAEQTEALQYVEIKKFKLKEVSKQGNVITVKFKTWLKPNTVKIIASEIVITFNSGISSSMTANSLFSQLSSYANRSNY